MSNKCKSCWWREGGRCYNEAFASITPCGFIRLGEEITPQLLTKCGRHNGFQRKRGTLEQIIPGDKLIITSEENKKGI